MKSKWWSRTNLLYREFLLLFFSIYSAFFFLPPPNYFVVKLQIRHLETLVVIGLKYIEDYTWQPYSSKKKFFFRQTVDEVSLKLKPV